MYLPLLYKKNFPECLRGKNYLINARILTLMKYLIFSVSFPSKSAVRVENKFFYLMTKLRDDKSVEYRAVILTLSGNNNIYMQISLFHLFRSVDGFKGDIVLWCKLLLPGAVKRIYNLQSKQLIKLFARLLLQDEDAMLEHLEQGDVAETISVFFENSAAVLPCAASVLTIQDVSRHNFANFKDEEKSW